MFLPDSSVVPNLLLTVVAYLAFHDPSLHGLLISFFLGLCLDLGSGVLVGPWAGGFVVVFIILSSMTQRIFVDSPLTAFTAVLIGSVIAQVVFVVLSMQFREFEFEWTTGVTRLTLEALFSAFCAPICFALLRKLRLIRVSRLV